MFKIRQFLSQHAHYFCSYLINWVLRLFGLCLDKCVLFFFNSITEPRYKSISIMTEIIILASFLIIICNEKWKLALNFCFSSLLLLSEYLKIYYYFFCHTETNWDYRIQWELCTFIHICEFYPSSHIKLLYYGVYLFCLILFLQKKTF